jgi:hypothetical protein
MTTDIEKMMLDQLARIEEKLDANHKDHEERIRTLEACQNKALGGLFVAGGVGGIVSWVVSLIRGNG